MFSSSVGCRETDGIILENFLFESLDIHGVCPNLSSKLKGQGGLPTW
ncbi:MAG: hypothetical protein P8163_07160 [Candidatus Thiodiazotropha sp.]